MVFEIVIIEAICERFMGFKPLDFKPVIVSTADWYSLKTDVHVSVANRMYSSRRASSLEASC